MLTVLIECHNHEAALAHTLSALVEGAVDGLVSDVILIDRGSTDGTARLADAAGCRFSRSEPLDAVVASARGRWFLLIEPGARPQPGWIEAIAEHLNESREAAAFQASRRHRLPLHKRLFSRRPAIETGLLISRDALSTAARGKDTLNALAEGHRRARLSAELVPAWALR